MHLRLLMLSPLMLLLAACGNPQSGPPPLSSPTFDKALLLLRDEARSPDATVRANCIEALQVSRDPRAVEIIEQGLHDEEWVVRFAAAMASGVQKADVARPVLNTLVVHDPSGSVRAGCIYALHQFGDDTHMSDLAILIERPDSPTRANTALVLGMLGNRSAIPLLQANRNDRDIRVKFEITRALARLGDEPSLHVVEGWSLNRFSEDQLNAMTVARDIDPAIGHNILLLGMEDPPKEFPAGFTEADKDAVRKLTLQRQLLAAASLAKLKDNKGAKLAIDNLNNTDARFRELSLFVLGELLNSWQVPGIDYTLQDPDDRVRLAAATAVMKIYARAANPGK